MLESTKSSGISGKCGQYKKLGDDCRAEVGKYASYHGVAPTFCTSPESYKRKWVKALFVQFDIASSEKLNSKGLKVLRR